MPTELSAKKTKFQDLGLKIPHDVNIGQIDFENANKLLGRGGQGIVRKGVLLKELCKRDNAWREKEEMGINRDRVVN